MITGYTVKRPRKSSPTGFRHAVYIRRTKGGKPEYLETFDTETEAKKALLLAQLGGQLPSAIKATPVSNERVDLTFDTYMTDHFLPNMPEPSTRRKYASYHRNHISPQLGTKTLREIDADMIEDALTAMRSKGASVSTISYTHAVISSVLGTEYKKRKLPSNPALLVSVKKPARKKKQEVSPEDVKKVLQALPNDAARLLGQTFIETGMRFGEGAELRRSDINWKTGAIILSRNVVELPADENPAKTGRFYVKHTKSDRSRVTSVSRSLLKLLDEHCTTHGIEDDDLLFPVTLVDPNGVSVHTNTALKSWGPNTTGHTPNHVWDRIWKRAVKATGVKNLKRPYFLRHSHITWLLKNGTDIRQVQKRAGHASMTTTMVYVQEIEEQDTGAAELIGDLMA
jgi:integrase